MQSKLTVSPTVLEMDVSAATSTPVEMEKKSKKLASAPMDVFTYVVWVSVFCSVYFVPSGRIPVIW